MDIDAFRQMVAKNPKGFLGRYGLGNKILQESGNLEEAVEHLTVATQLDSTHVASHLGLGRALVSLGRKDEAKPILQAGIDAARSGQSNGGMDLRASPTSTILLRRTMARHLLCSRPRKILNVFQQIRLRFSVACGRAAACPSFAS